MCPQLRSDSFTLLAFGSFQDSDGAALLQQENLISCQALFAGASLVTTYLVADRSNPSATAVGNDFDIFSYCIAYLAYGALYLSVIQPNLNTVRAL